MHRIKIRPEVIERVTKRRRDVHPFSSFDPSTAALVVVDMQKGFVDDAFPGAVPMAKEIVGNINLLADAMRRNGGHVVWIQNSASADDVAGWAAVCDNFMGDQARDGMIASLTKGTDGFELVPELLVDSNDIRVVKNRFSAFIQGSSDIEAQLRGRGIDTVLVTGTVTNVCCESTARDAAMRNFKVIMVADGNAARSDEDHNASLNSLFNIFADVLTTDEIIANLNASDAASRRHG